MPKAAARTRRLGPGILLYGAAVAVAVGAFIQMRAAAVVVTCERDKGAALGCILDRRVLFNTVSIGRERVAGVRAARIDHRTGTSRRGRWGAFAVVLETAEGERDAGWSTGWNPAAAMTTAISRHIATGAGRFEESLQPHFFDSLLRLFGLVASLVGLAWCPWPCCAGVTGRRPDGPRPVTGAIPIVSGPRRSRSRQTG